MEKQPNPFSDKNPPKGSDSFLKSQVQTWEWEGGEIKSPSDEPRLDTETTALHAVLSKDYALIDEALRRLLEGTCCLVDEDKLSAFELFHKLREALVDHIQFEEQTVFPILENTSEMTSAFEFIKSMRMEHSHLQELLTATLKELEDSRAIAFRAVLRELSASLRRHRELENRLWSSSVVSSWTDENLKRIAIRVRGINL